MPYLLDTNHCIYLMNGSEKTENDLSTFEHNTIEMVHIFRNEPCYMSEVSLGELYYGVAFSNMKEHNFNKIALFRESVLTLSLDTNIWMLFGETKAYLRKQGKTITDFDLLIACTAKTYNLILVTNDSDFEVLPESFERVNWAGKER
ncbi:type II toxin-antitoxin system VapC family toxin [Candidatus Magnetomonas plexicatena]|uniref:type II toxin-antitoxin system VapC family toxin n=1 Tax=Candidatus Magnetomonas plexicatena TaxID=2552947 RepID=UPI0011022134|nr:type II toxin-antitoxin system VapC family toxin [Nitrospirales bacterium LBB_01]